MVARLLQLTGVYKLNFNQMVNFADEWYKRPHFQTKPDFHAKAVTHLSNSFGVKPSNDQGYLDKQGNKEHGTGFASFGLGHKGISPTQTHNTLITSGWKQHKPGSSFYTHPSHPNTMVSHEDDKLKVQTSNHPLEQNS